MYQFEESRIVNEIKKRGSKRVLLQMPEGLKPHGFKLAKLLEEKTGVEVFVSGDPCYGACDLALSPKKAVEADLLVHVGHAEIPGEFPEENVLYVEARADMPIDEPLIQGNTHAREGTCDRSCFEYSTHSPNRSRKADSGRTWKASADRSPFGLAEVPWTSSWDVTMGACEQLRRKSMR